ncbi:probable LRR receptor-like serine/threonine-protein kinase At2g24230 isoform X2 [Hibiscus syriacus]|uniref:probable LRR receptor-like serine/threonine-protein kinase At2g24230 isoform X2 n=1 Tax=Hibiscus syriacus TaxID=106335 RepID=UPI001922FE13|nr:probable LRR receptor-like serine/threonine-protein kinase At2g24230 isoform X2 [Hibiscus syriacus]
MAFGFFGYLLILSLFLKLFTCQLPNTDGYYVSDFLKKMRLNSSLSYNFSGSVCSWEGVHCDAKKESVIGLKVSSFGLSGLIPDTTIGKLTKLQSLDLSINKITALPSDLWGLGTLQSLNLSSNQISGSLPNNFGNFGLLEVIDLSGNNFSGEIPAAISSLLSLQVLNLAGNGFQWSIPKGILNCKSMVSLDLSSNRLNGSLPDGFGAALPKLKTLNLAGNEILGRDTDFKEMISLTSLNISRNLFKGSIMGFFQGQLQVIDLSRNQFQGHFSQKFPRIEMLLGLEYLNLSKTGLIGHIPGEISQLSHLHTLDVSSNHLTGQIPSLANKSLKVLDVSRNNLTGEFPFSLLEKLPSMKRYNFSYNNLTLCASRFSFETFNTVFYGSSNSCPIAANPVLFKRRAGGQKGLKLALALTLSLVCLLAVLLILAFGCRRKSSTWVVKQPSYKEEQHISGPFSFQTDSTTWVADVKQATLVSVVIFEKPLLNITFADLLSATSNFDRGTLLAEGKFGPVYRGFLPGGIHVAVKVLVHESTLTDQEVARELEYLGRIKHPNLVPLTGYCLAGDQRIAIYDYMENGNLQNLLHDLPLGVQAIEDWSQETWEEDNNGIQNVGSEGLLTTWSFRHKIALGTARALAFLHHGCSPPIIHRDVKASSVYLDLNLEPRLSDFGLAKIFGTELEDEIARGSPGYVPPEFSQPEYQASTPKSDVYCFGVVLFELITGKKPIGDDYPEEQETNLVSWVRGLVRKSRGSKAIDPKIRDTGPGHQMEEALKIGYLCTACIPIKRPNMQQVVGLLKDIEPRTPR